MNSLETIAVRLRHLPGLRRLKPLWSALRPLYEGVLKAFAGDSGLPRVINGMDSIRVLPEWRNLGGAYEPEVWKLLLPAIRPGDIIADVGAHVGLYAVAMGARTGATGRVLAVEADPGNLPHLRAHLKLNVVDNIVEVVPKALSDHEGRAVWHSQDVQSGLVPGAGGGQGVSVELTTLDQLLGGGRLDLMLIDIEGYEEAAVRGGARLLADPARRPRMIVVEVHPYAWQASGGSSATLLSLLHGLGYEVSWLDGRPVTEISAYGHVMAVPVKVKRS
jgi:FkbM family methyltransferase